MQKHITCCAAIVYKKLARICGPGFVANPERPGLGQDAGRTLAKPVGRENVGEDVFAVNAQWLTLKTDDLWHKTEDVGHTYTFCKIPVDAAQVVL